MNNFTVILNSVGKNSLIYMTSWSGFVSGVLGKIYGLASHGNWIFSLMQDQESGAVAGNIGQTSG